MPRAGNYLRTYCSAMIKFNPVRFAQAERRAVEMGAAQALEELVRAAAEGGLARYANFPDGIKIRYHLELADNGRTWVVVVIGDLGADHICALPDRRRYLEDGRLCSSPGAQLQWR
jgi:hypothetical protein